MTTSTLAVVTGHTPPPHLTTGAGTAVAALILILALALIAIAKAGADEANKR